ncbi:MAG: hypothetical protein ABWX96_19590, partial [Propionibacteriaceae bacterium]
MTTHLNNATLNAPTPHPVVRTVNRNTRGWLTAFAVLTLVATNQLFVLAEYTAQGFAWTIQPPLTAAFLGAGYAAGFVLVVLALRTETWAHARVVVVTVLAFTALTLVATLLHLDKFHFSAEGLIPRFAAWFWLAVYVFVPIGLTLAVISQHRNRAADPARQLPMPRWLAVVLSVQGLIMLVVGVVLFVAPSAASSIWPWTLTPLTARMVAAWLVAFGLAMGLAMRERDLLRLEIPAIGYTVFGLLQLVALVRFRDQVSWDSPAAAA